MLPSTETLYEAIDNLKALPPHSCPDVDKALKTLRGASRDASSAADDALNLSRHEEDPTTAKAIGEASEALESASTAITDAAEALDHERDIAAALRDGADRRESIARLAIRACEERDEMIRLLEEGQRDRDNLIESQREVIDLMRHQKGVSQRVIDHLSAQIRGSWWIQMANATKRLWWQARAKGMKKRIRRLETDKAVLADRNNTLFDALMVADGVLAEQEWEDGPFGQTWCPSCHATVTGFFQGAKHEAGCRVGQACETIRSAMRAEARDHGLDPHHTGGQSREFQV